MVLTSAYRDSVTAPFGHKFDDNAVGLDDGDGDDPDNPEVILRKVLLLIKKVSDYSLWLYNSFYISLVAA